MHRLLIAAMAGYNDAIDVTMTELLQTEVLVPSVSELGETFKEVQYLANEESPVGRLHGSTFTILESTRTDGSKNFGICGVSIMDHLRVAQRK